MQKETNPTPVVDRYLAYMQDTFFVYRIAFNEMTGEKGYLCYAFIHEKTDEAPVVFVGLSACNPKDKFSKKLAQEYAIEFALTRKYTLNYPAYMAANLKSHLQALAQSYVKYSTQLVPPTWALRHAVLSEGLKMDWMSPKQFLAMNAVRKFYITGLASLYGCPNCHDDFKDFNYFCKEMKVTPESIKLYMGEKKGQQ